MSQYVLSKQLGALLLKKGRLLALAESCTGGGLAAMITEVAGSSGWFDRGFVTYSNAAKIEMLGVDAEAIERHGAVSEAVAKQMAEGVIAHSQSDIALSITGVAGPDGGTPDKPVGTVWFGLAVKGGGVQAQVAHFTSGRRNVRDSAITFGLEWLSSALSPE